MAVALFPVATRGHHHTHCETHPLLSLHRSTLEPPILPSHHHPCFPIVSLKPPSSCPKREEASRAVESRKDLFTTPSGVAVPPALQNTPSARATDADWLLAQLCCSSVARRFGAWQWFHWITQQGPRKHLSVCCHIPGPACSLRSLWTPGKRFFLSVISHAIPCFCFSLYLPTLFINPPTLGLHTLLLGFCPFPPSARSQLFLVSCGCQVGPLFLRLFAWRCPVSPLVVLILCQGLDMRVRTLKAKSSIEAPFSGSLFAPNLNNLTHSYYQVSSHVDALF